MRSLLSVFLILLSLSATILAAAGTYEVRSPRPSARHEARSPRPSARHEARSPRPSARHEARSPRPSARHEARSPRPSARHEARSPRPSARHEARAPQPSAKRDIVRRDMNEQTALMNLDTVLCPFRMSACPIEPTSALPTSLAGWSIVDHECVEFETDLQSCGGCSSIDVRHDCTAIEGSANVACMSGECKVETCEAGFRLSSDAKSCTAN